MFLLSRFKLVRHLSIYFSGQPILSSTITQKSYCLNSVEEDKIIDTLNKDGLYVGINLSSKLVKQICDYADNSRCYGNRNTHFFFDIGKKKQQRKNIIRPLLLVTI